MKLPTFLYNSRAQKTHVSLQWLNHLNPNIIKIASDVHITKILQFYDNSKFWSIWRWKFSKRVRAVTNFFIFERRKEASSSIKVRKYVEILRSNKQTACIENAKSSHCRLCKVCENNQEICQLTWAHGSRKSGELKNISSSRSASFFAYTWSKETVEGEAFTTILSK